MSRFKFSTALAMLGALSSTSCEESLSAQQQSLDRFVAKHQIGQSADYWLEVLNLYGEWERVALITGYFDDYSGCTDIAKSLMDDFGSQYRCTPAN
jgi:hypothetical protein